MNKLKLCLVIFALPVLGAVQDGSEKLLSRQERKALLYPQFTVLQVKSEQTSGRR
jgi:hypothetical protein